MKVTCSAFYRFMNLWSLSILKIVNVSHKTLDYNHRSWKFRCIRYLIHFELARDLYFICLDLNCLFFFSDILFGINNFFNLILSKTDWTLWVVILFFFPFFDSTTCKMTNVMKFQVFLNFWLTLSLLLKFFLCFRRRCLTILFWMWVEFLTRIGFHDMIL